MDFISPGLFVPDAPHVFRYLISCYTLCFQEDCSKNRQKPYVKQLMALLKV